MFFTKLVGFLNLAGSPAQLSITFLFTSLFSYPPYPLDILFCTKLGQLNLLAICFTQTNQIIFIILEAEKMISKMKGLDSSSNGYSTLTNSSNTSSTLSNSSKLKDINVLPNNQSTLPKTANRSIPPEQFKSNILKGKICVKAPLYKCTIINQCFFYLHITPEFSLVITVNSSENSSVKKLSRVP